MKRIFLFLMTNIAAVAMLTIAASVICALCGVDLAASLGDLGLAHGEKEFEDCCRYLCGMNEMKAAGEAAVPRLRKAMRSVFR
jgi:hypothetical protein